MNDEVARLMSALCDGTLSAEGNQRLDALEATTLLRKVMGEIP